jgi:hypothetical protein
MNTLPCTAWTPTASCCRLPAALSPSRPTTRISRRWPGWSLGRAGGACQLLIRLHPNHFMPGSLYEQEANRVRAGARPAARAPGGAGAAGRRAGPLLGRGYARKGLDDGPLGRVPDRLLHHGGRDRHPRPPDRQRVHRRAGRLEHAGQVLALAVRDRRVAHPPALPPGRAGRVALTSSSCARTSTAICEIRIADGAQRRKFIQDECTFTDGSAGRRTGDGELLRAGLPAQPPAEKGPHEILIAGFGSIGRRHLRNLRELGEQDSAATAPPLHPAGRRDRRAAGRNDPSRPPWLTAQMRSSSPTRLRCTWTWPSPRPSRAAPSCSKSPSRIRPGASRRARAAAARGGARVLVGFQFRLPPHAAPGAELLADGAIGQPLAARAHWGEYLPNWHPWEDYRQGYAARADLGGGVILTLSHPFDYLRMAAGRRRIAAGLL